MPAAPLKVLRWRELMSTRLTSGDAQMRRAMRHEESSKTGSWARRLRWWMRSIVRHAHKQIAHGSPRCTTCQRHLCTDCHAKEIGKAPVTRATGRTATPPTAAPLPPEPQTRHEPRTSAAPPVPVGRSLSASRSPMGPKRTRPQVCDDPTSSP